MIQHDGKTPKFRALQTDPKHRKAARAMTISRNKQRAVKRADRKLVLA